MAEFSGRRVVVMEANRGIRRSIALGFAAGGAARAIYARGTGRASIVDCGQLTGP